VKEMVKDLDECAASEGRTVSSGTLSEVMLTLFAKERERQLAWINEVSEKLPEEAAALTTTYDSGEKFAEMGSTVEPLAGTLVPSSTRALSNLPSPPKDPIAAPPAPEPTVRTRESEAVAAPSSRKWLVGVVAIGSAALVVAIAAFLASMFGK